MLLEANLKGLPDCCDDVLRETTVTLEHVTRTTERSIFGDICYEIHGVLPQQNTELCVYRTNEILTEIVELPILTGSPPDANEIPGI